MNLRPRLILTSLTVALPLVAGASWLRARQEREAEIERVLAVGQAIIESGGLDREPLGADGRGPRRGGGRPEGRGSDRLDGPPSGRSGDEGPLPSRSDDDLGGPGGRRRTRGPGPSPDGGRLRGPGRGRPGPIAVHAYNGLFEPVSEAQPHLHPELVQALQTGSTRASVEESVGEEYELTVAVPAPWLEEPIAYVSVSRRHPEPSARPSDHLASGLLAGGLVLAVSFLAAGPLVGRVRRLTRALEDRSPLDAGEPLPPNVTGGNDEVTELARAIQGSYAATREAHGEIAAREQTLRRFVDNTTHDVAVPLSVLQSHLSALITDGQQSASLDGAVQEVHYVASILRNLSTVARLEAGEEKLESSDVDLNAVVERSVIRHQAIAERANIQLESSVPEDPVSMLGNVALLEEALSNLIHNSLRYNRSGGHVAVVLRRLGGGAFELRVADDGPGIEDEVLDTLVQRAQRSDQARARFPDGRGLGLHIVTDVAARHGLEVTFGREASGGLEVTLRSQG